MHFDSLGRIRGKHPAAAYENWRPFVGALGSIVILARVDTQLSDDSGVIVEGEGVVVHPLPYYAGARALLLGALRVWMAMRRVGTSADTFIGRVPEITTLLTFARARQLRAPHMAMLVADPRNMRSLVPDAVVRPFSSLMTRLARHAVRNASAVSYVSEGYFQSIYPAGQDVPTIGRSNVVLGSDWANNGARELRKSGTLKLISVGTLEHNGKGMDFLLDVIARLEERGTRAQLTIVGDGRLEAVLQRAAGDRQLDVTFTGQINDRRELRQRLDSADIYVSGSRSEGLPRSTVEAMARGLPVVTTDAGAASELVGAPFLVPIDGLEEFCNGIEQLAKDPAAYREQSARSIATSARINAAADPARLMEFLRINLRTGENA